MKKLWSARVFLGNYVLANWTFFTNMAVVFLSATIMEYEDVGAEKTVWVSVGATRTSLILQFSGDSIYA